MPTTRTQANIDTFRFRDLHPLLRIGTASDRYAGWMGQVYSRDRYQGRITRRIHRVGKTSFEEKVLPVESVKEYFQHFSVLEIDFTFYQTLLQPDGSLARTHHVLKNYCNHLHDDDRVLLKVPQAVTAQTIHRRRQYLANPTYLDADLFTEQFYKPAVELLGSALGGFIFEQEYQRIKDRVSADVVTKALDEFFAQIPADTRYHLELRTEQYLTPGLFDVLKRHGIGQVLSYWTWMPSLTRQLSKSGNRFLNLSGECVIRLLTPRGVKYEDAYAAAHPFNTLIEGMMQSRMIEETVTVIKLGIQQGITMNVIVNNRSGGNAPLIAQQVAREFIKT